MLCWRQSDAVVVVVINVLEDFIRFGPFQLAPSDYSLTRVLADGTVTEVPLRPKAFDLLRYMVENAGRLISPEEFFDRLWPNIHVQADGLKGHMLHVRAALGDDPSEPTFIETIRGRGYRFIAPVLLPEAADGRDTDRHRPTGLLLVGRSAPRRELDTMLRHALAGEAGVGFVTGEPGIGKTSLASDFVRAAVDASALTVTSRCLPGGADNDAYYPILDALTQLARGEAVKDFVGLLSSIAPTWLIQLPWLMPATMAGGTRQDVFGTTQHRMIRELCDLLDMLSRDRLFVLLIEDIHWADQATLELINAIAVRRLQSRLLFLATMRGSGDHASARCARTLCQTLSLYRLGREVSLKALTVDDVADYLFGVSGFTPPHRLAGLLHQRSEGNPLFMTAMLDHFVQEGLLVIGEDGWIMSDRMAEAATRAPPSLARIIESEIDKLEPDAQAVLEAGSICEGEFSAAENHVATALDEERFEALCEHLVRNTALVRRANFAVLPSGRKVQRYAFHHMIFREVAYDRQSATRLAASHLAIGTGLEEIYANDLSAGASALARNFLAAEQWCKAIVYLRLVARNAQTRFSAREAAATLEQALELTVHQPAARRLDTEVELLEDLARVYAGSLDARAGQTYVRLAETAARAGRLEVECRALLGLGFTLAWTDLDRSMAVLSEAVEKSAGLEDRVARARIRSFGHGWRNWASGWNEEDAKACEAAIEIIRAEGDPVTVNASYVDYSLIVFTSSRYQESYDLISSCFDILVAKAREQRSDISLPLWIWRLGRPWSLLYAGSFGEALRLFHSGVASFLDNGDVGRAATLQFYQGFCHLHLQDHAGALALCDGALNFCDVRGTVGLTPNEQQIEMVVRGLAELGAGHSDIAIDLLTAAGDVMRQRRTLTTWHWDMAREWGMADACLAAGLLDQSRRHADHFRNLAYAIRERTWRALASETAARIALRIGDLAAVDDRLREAWQETEAGALPLVAWRLHAVEARLHERRGDGEGAKASRRAWRDALAELADTLPEGHIGRQTLAGAEPIFG
jgi:DNA-binding winged helix-turn-helix (wHTH) protein